MPTRFKQIAVRHADADAAERVFGNRIPKADRLGVGVRAYELLNDSQKLQALGIATQPTSNVDLDNDVPALAS